jgi:hypothetical protein
MKNKLLVVVLALVVSAAYGQLDSEQEDALLELIAANRNDSYDEFVGESEDALRKIVGDVAADTIVGGRLFKLHVFFDVLRRATPEGRERQVAEEHFEYYGARLSEIVRPAAMAHILGGLTDVWGNTW